MDTPSPWTALSVSSTGPVGLSETIERMVDAFERSRLVSVIGTAGVGKTTVAKAAVARWVRSDTSMTCQWLDACSAAVDPECLMQTLAQGGIGPHSDCLLVIDGASELADRDAGAGTALRDGIHRWLSQSEHRRVLTTSRRRLGWDGEVTVLAKPMALTHAMALFDAEARAADITYRPTDREVSATAEIVGLVGMLPLAVKMCAAQTTVLRPEALLDHLRSPTARLQMEGREGLSLRAIVGATVELLSPELRDVLTGCAVFEGPFSFSAASHVVQASLAVLKRLLDRSLLAHEDTAHGRGLQMLPVIRDYVLEAARTRDGGVDLLEVRQRHSAFYRGAEMEVVEPSQWRLNLLAAARFEVTQDHWEAVCQAIELATPWLLRQGGAREAVAMLGSVPPSRPIPATTLLAHARLLVRDGRLGQASERLALAAQKVGSKVELGAAVALEEAGIARVTGDHEEAASAYARCHELAPSAPLRGLGMERWGGLCFEMGDTATAKERFGAAAKIYESLGDAMGQARVEHAMGMVAQQAGQLGLAREYFASARASHRRLGDARAEAIAAFDLAALSMEEGQWHRAAEAMLLVQVELEAVGEQRQRALAIALRGVCQHRGGDFHGAATHLADAMELATAIDDQLFMRAIAVHCQHLSAVGGPATPLELPDAPDRDAATSDEERFAWRILDLAKYHDDRQIEVCPAGTRVCCDGRWKPVRSGPGQRILVALCEASGAVVSVDQLLRAGWPGDRSLTASAKNRLFVALSALRKAGLGDRLQRRDDGYHIDADVRWAPAADEQD